MLGLSALIGIGATVRGREAILQVVKNVRAATDMRKRPPKAGDYWDGCNDARAAGAAPIYRGEPGYREGMDGDGDGIACEAY
ncbi:excalibur calcium-binding domain-containing protein [Sphingobium phenoxybenzoativorans]|uniref:Excalibur calcium-binding domain-containing protein n=2 Tax=Sphingobium phenoxybenzoativorans TaxID=1592790 RepID=A0A975KBT2_9SPHN|nr:excalibur calcium-binding domain-containing protein [Sphingobium phenoxybenzoativorans]